LFDLRLRICTILRKLYETSLKDDFLRNFKPFIVARVYLYTISRRDSVYLGLLIMLFQLII